MPTNANIKTIKRITDAMVAHSTDLQAVRDEIDADEDVSDDARDSLDGVITSLTEAKETLEGLFADGE